MERANVVVVVVHWRGLHDCGCGCRRVLNGDWRDVVLVIGVILFICLSLRRDWVNVVVAVVGSSLEGMRESFGCDSYQHLSPAP